MNELSVNCVLKSTESGCLHRVLWNSPERTEAYIFNMKTLEMPQQLIYSVSLVQAPSPAAPGVPHYVRVPALRVPVPPEGPSPAKPGGIQ